MRTELVERPFPLLTWLFGVRPRVEEHKLITERELVDGVVSRDIIPKFDDMLSRRYIHCRVCGKDQLARFREYGTGYTTAGLAGGYFLTTVWSCSVCDTLTNPDREHRYGYTEG